MSIRNGFIQVRCVAREGSAPSCCWVTLQQELFGMCNVFERAKAERL